MRKLAADGSRTHQSGRTPLSLDPGTGWSAKNCRTCFEYSTSVSWRFLSLESQRHSRARYSRLSAPRPSVRAANGLVGADSLPTSTHVVIMGRTAPIIASASHMSIAAPSDCTQLPSMNRLYHSPVYSDLRSRT